MKEIKFTRYYARDNSWLIDRLDRCFTANQGDIREAIQLEFRNTYESNEMDKVLDILIERIIEDANKIADLEHHKATTVGLWATDRPDLIPSDLKEKVFFEIT